MYFYCKLPLGVEINNNNYKTNIICALGQQLISIEVQIRKISRAKKNLNISINVFIFALKIQLRINS